MSTRTIRVICLAGVVSAFLMGFLGPSVCAGMPGCDTAADMQQYAPAFPWPLTITSVTDVPASGSTSEYCNIIGYVTTNGEGAGPGKAGFEVGIPAPGSWNGKYLFIGNGGLGVGLTAFPGASQQGLQKGYAVATTDMGHPSNSPFDGTWALASPGVPNTPALIDYYYRATHETALAGKQFVEAYYGKNSPKHGPKKIHRSYYQGCSTGGRQGLLEAERYPDDFDGLIAGDPVAGFAHQAPSQTGAEFAFLRPPTAWLPPSALAVIDKAVYAQCDPHHVGIVQDPAACSFDPWSLLCKGGSTTNCLTKDQINGLIRYGGPFYDEFGNTVMPGYPMTDLSAPGAGIQVMTLGFYPPPAPTAAEPWGTGTGTFTPIHWGASDGTYPYFVFLTETYNQQDFPVFFFGNRGVIGEWALLLNDFRTDLGDTTYPQLLRRFAEGDKKMILYHGFSDPLITPYQTMQLYEDTALITPGGYRGLQENIRLFMAPGMFHCGGGPGPSTFDTLTALEGWVEEGNAPDAIPATGGSTSECASLAMPLCKFPEVATYNGGDVCSAASWSCDPENQGLLHLGLDGHLAGLPYSYLGR